MRTFFAVGAQMASAVSTYSVHLRVRVPWDFYPCVKLKPHELALARTSFDEAALGEFVQASKRINRESRAILDTARFEWRKLTEAESRRLDELFFEHEIAVATLERTRATSN